MNSLTEQYDNPTCSNENNSESRLKYNLLVDISDHSGTLTNCRMMSSTLETVLGYPVTSFESSLYNCLEYPSGVKLLQSTSKINGILGHCCDDEYLERKGQALTIFSPYVPDSEAHKVSDFLTLLRDVELDS